MLTTSGAGPTLYMGNNPYNELGSFVTLPFVRPNTMYEEEDFRAAAEARLGRPLTQKEVSAYWLEEALAHIRSRPAFAVRVWFRKLALFCSDYEIPDAWDMEFLARYSPALRLPFLVSLATLAPLAAAGVVRALAVIESERPQVLLTDLRMPGLDGIGLLKAAKRIDPAIKVVLLTAYASIQTAVASMRHGAFDYLAKPFTGQELRTVVQRALSREDGDASAREDVQRVPAKYLAESDALAQEGVLIGNSTATQMVREVVERVAATEAALLISGETGTGKESVARTIHARSARRTKSFVPVSCIAGDESAFEAQLFGARCSSGSQAGLLESANGGTPGPMTR